ncbi:efflux RND transporter periplasmic adaptor subunit [Candidatus Cyanaurora vandensis]|uniref:efflux RND transporter periplasmic adaptor subunit n=1 Tax=Candidatus Cyanaurora vandensis TaxID=2714958 RepID=UPI00257EE563|nr:efflux RND transporter periplasmic adaptor subunit [Candidatus Cyanaurora vandensis]
MLKTAPFAMLLSLTLGTVPALASPVHTHGGGFSEAGGGVQAVEVSPEVQKQMGITVAPVTTRPLAQGIIATGRIESIPERTAEVNAPISGRLVRVLARQGQQVQAGQALAVLDSPELRELAVVSQQQRGQAQATITRLQAQVGLAQSTYRREQELYTAKISAGKEVEQARAALVSAQAELQAAQSQLRLVDAPLQARLGQLGGSGGTTGLITLKAPQSGYLTMQEAVSGEAVEPGRVLFRIVNVAQVWATADVYEKDLAQIRVGQPIEVRTTAQPGRVFTGRVAVINPVLDPAARTLQIHAVLPNPKQELKPGIFTTLKLVTGAGAAVPVIPSSALLDVDGQKLVYVKTGADNFEPVNIEVTEEAADFVAVTGLAKGDMVVTTRAFQLRAQGLKASGEKAEEVVKREVIPSSGQDAPLWVLVLGGLVVAAASFTGGVYLTRNNQPQLNKGS